MTNDMSRMVRHMRAAVAFALAMYDQQASHRTRLAGRAGRAAAIWPCRPSSGGHSCH
jgi:hypothetical protein